MDALRFTRFEKLVLRALVQLLRYFAFHGLAAEIDGELKADEEGWG